MLVSNKLLLLHKLWFINPNPNECHRLEDKRLSDKNVIPQSALKLEMLSYGQPMHNFLMRIKWSYYRVKNF